MCNNRLERDGRHKHLVRDAVTGDSSQRLDCVADDHRILGDGSSALGKLREGSYGD